VRRVEEREGVHVEGAASRLRDWRESCERFGKVESDLLELASSRVGGIGNSSDSD
jgi:hypothetical protein